MGHGIVRQHRRRLMILVFGKIYGDGETGVQFILGVVLFVMVVGLVDARIPWPKPRKRGDPP
jgi:hypothetical protein